MREFDEVRERFARIQDYILSALAEARGELYDLPDTVEHELENLISQAEYYAEDLVSVVDNYEEDFVPGGVVTVYNVPVTLTVLWDRDSMEAVEVRVSDYTHGWSPDTVETEDGDEIPSSSTQCGAWQGFLRGLPDTDVNV